MKSTTPRFLLKHAFVLVGFWGLFTSNSYGQTYVNGDYQSVATGTWATAATWQKFVGGVWAATGVNVAPPSGYTAGTIYIQTGTTVTVAATPLSEGYLYINGGSLSINPGVTFTVANGTNANDLNIVSGSVINNGTLSLATTSIGVSNSGTLTNNLGGTVNMNGATTTITNNAGAVLTNSGTMLNGGTNVLTNNGTINNNLTFTNNGTITNNNAINNAGTFIQSSTAFTNAAAGVLTNYSILTISSTKTLVNNGTIVNATAGVINSGPITYGTLLFNNGSLYQHNFNSAAGTVPNATWAAGSTCEILACGNSGNGPTNLSQTFSDFTWNNSTQTPDISLNAQLGTVRNLTIKNTNTFNVVLRTSSNGIPAVTTVTGDLIILPGGNLVLTNGDAEYSTSNHTLNVAGNYTQTGGKCALTNCSANTSTPVTGGTGTLNIAGNLNFNAGTLNICASTAAAGCVTGTASGILNLTGNCNISGGTVSVCSSTVTGGGGTGTMNIAGSFTHIAGTVTKTGANTGVININGTALQTIESIGFSATSNLGFNIQQSGAGTTTIVANKTFVLNSNTIFTLYDNTSVTTDFTINGTFTTNTNTWMLNTAPAPASQTEVSGRFKNTSATIGTSDSITLTNGVYIIKALSADGMIVQKRFVKQ
ncbi:MAG: C-terminal target protein [Bacteroidetes bacterium]|nr:C-terminal target protein [Bacteroidota bacterium]